MLYPCIISFLIRVSYHFLSASCTCIICVYVLVLYITFFVSIPYPCPIISKFVASLCPYHMLPISCIHVYSLYFIILTARWWFLMIYVNNHFICYTWYMTPCILYLIFITWNSTKLWHPKFRFLKFYKVSKCPIHVRAKVNIWCIFLAKCQVQEMCQT